MIDKALAQFWSQGFAASDVDRLTHAAAVNRHSLYKAFGGKRGLFLESLRRYVEGVAAGYVTILEEGGSLADIVAYFAYATGAKQADSPGVEPAGFDQRGCFLVNTAIEWGRSDPEIAAVLDAYYARIEQAFAGLIRRGQQTGSIRTDIDPQATAQWLRMTSQGLSVSSRIASPPGDLAQAIGSVLAAPAIAQGERG